MPNLAQQTILRFIVSLYLPMLISRFSKGFNFWTGEKIALRRACRVTADRSNDEILGKYLHHSGKIGSAVLLKGHTTDQSETLATQVLYLIGRFSATLLYMILIY